MSVLKRSAETFWRSGSSGLVWDDRFFFGDGDEMNKDESGIDGRGDAFREKRTSRSTGFIGSKMECCQSKYNDETCCLSPALEPPLPQAFKMPELQRSVATFRRSGSSGLVWDDTFFAENRDLKNKDEGKRQEKEDEFRELRPSQSMGFSRSGVMARHQSDSIQQTTCAPSGLPPPPPPPPHSKSFGRKVFRVIRKTMSTKQPKVSCC